MRGVGRALLVAMLGLLLLEVVLQIASYWTWRTTRPEAGAGVEAADRVVLCVGDSYTYGIGSTSAEATYPRQLEALLRRSGGERWKVVASARPGRNSREVLEKIDAALRAFRPELTYVLVGLNDRWSRPELLELDSAARSDDYGGERFRWEWRTLRLLALARSRRGVDEAPRNAAPASGVPRNAGPASGAPQNAPPDAAPQPAEHAPPRYAQYGGNEDVGPGWSALGRGDLTAAEQLLLAQIDRTGDRAPFSRMALVHVYMRKSEREAALAQVRWLRERLAEAPYEDLAASLVAALSALGDGESCLREARAWLERFPESPALWEHFGWQTFQRGDRAAAIPALEKAIALAPRDQSGWRASLLRMHAQATLHVDARLSLESAIRSYLIDGDGPRLRDTLLDREDAYDTKSLEAVLEALALPEATRTEIRRLFAEAFGWEASGVEQVYEAHLRQIVARIRASGAQPVLLSYPMHLDWVARAAQRVATDTGAGWLDVAGTFDAALARARWEDLFVTDGHCSDAGYALMARAVAEDARGRLGLP